MSGQDDLPLGDPRTGVAKPFASLAEQRRQQRIRDDALKRVEANARQRWLECVEGIVLAIALGGEFTTSDIEIAMRRSYPHIETHEPRAMGAVIRKLACRGQIVRTGARKRTGSHGRDQTVWMRTRPGTGPASLAGERARKIRYDERWRIAAGVRRYVASRKIEDVRAKLLADTIEGGECICGGEEHGGGNHLPWCFAAYRSDLEQG